MKINLVESEIQTALVEYINNQGFDLSNKQVKVTLVAGRGANGHSAQIEALPFEDSDVVDDEDGDPSIKSQQAIPFDFIQATE